MMRHLAQYQYVGHTALKFTMWLYSDIQKQKNKFVKAPLWTEFRRTETVTVMLFSYQTKIKEYYGDIIGNAGDALA